MYLFLGWLNVFFLLVMTSPYWLRYLDKHVLHLNKGAIIKPMKVLRKIHKPLGAMIIIIAVVHGYLALGAFRPHTGVVLLASIVLAAALGISFFLSKKKTLFKLHKLMGLIVILAFLIHLVFPNALYYLFN